MRAELAGYRISPEYVVRRWFDEPSIVEDILACTRHLPRDVILFFNSLQTLRKNPPFSRKDFHHALRVYSPLFLSALNDSVKGLLPNAVRQQLQHVLKDLPTRFSFGELRTSLQRRGLVGSSFPSAETIAHELFATGWIGNQRQQGPRYSFQYRNMGLTFDQRGTCVVHRGLGPVLGI